MPEQSLKRLLDGNRRYAANRLEMDVSPDRRVAVAKSQTPFAMIFGCVDSRVSPELVFDQDLGDLLVIRTAGQVLDQAVLGSLQFGVAVLNIPVLVVLGHERCGAVKSAIDALQEGGAPPADMAYLAGALRPAVEEGMKAGGDAWDLAGRAQVARQVEALRRAPVLAQAVERGALKVAGAWYSLETGRVEVIVE